MAKRRSRGEGSIFFSEQENTWIAELTLPDGTQKRKRNKRQSVVREWLAKQRSAVRDGVFVKDDQMTVSAFLDSYFNDVAVHSLRPRTVEAYGSLLRVHIKPGLGKIKLTQLRADHIQSFYSQKLASGLSNRTVQFMHSVIHKALKQAVKWGLVVRNVSDLVEAPSVKRKTFVTWTPEQVREFLELVKGHRFYPIYVLAVGTGMREGELLAIKFEDVLWEQKAIQVRRAVQYITGRGVIVVEPKSEKGKRLVPLPDFAFQVLKEHCERQKQNQGFIFVTKNETPFSPRNFIRHFKQVIEKSDLPDIRFHDLRHYHATYLLSQNVHPSVVQHRLGHSSVLLTLDTYSHVLPSIQHDAAAKANEMFNP